MIIYPSNKPSHNFIKISTTLYEVSVGVHSSCSASRDRLPPRQLRTQITPPSSRPHRPRTSLFCPHASTPRFFPSALAYRRAKSAAREHAAIPFHPRASTPRYQVRCRWKVPAPQRRMEGPHAHTPAGRSLIERTRMEGHRTRMEDADGRSVAKSRDPQPPPLSWTRMECQRSPLRSVNGRQTSLEWTFHPPSQITDASEATGPFISIRPQEFQTPLNPRVPFFSRSILLGRIRFFSQSIALKIPRVANVTVLKVSVS
jgi:ribosomal protein L34